MEIIIISLSIFIGLYLAFLTGIVHSLSQDIITASLQSHPQSSKRIEFAWDNYDRINESFHILEHISYLLSTLFLGFYLYSKNFTLLEFSIGSISFIIVLLLVRTFIYSIGKRTGSNTFLGNLRLIIFFNILALPIFMLTDTIVKVIRGNDFEDDSRDEISAAVETAREEGSLDDDEYRILKNIMRFSDVLVSDVMTPRTVIFSCNACQKVTDTVNLPEISMYSRFPIWEGESLDDGIMGYILSKDILQAALQGKGEITLKEFKREVYYIPENARLDTALDMFLNRRQHLFVVVDEYGGVEGLLTMEDVLETMLGVEIVDEADRFVDMRLLAKQRRDKRISVVTPDFLD